MAIISLRAYNHEIEGMIDNGQQDEAVAHCRHILTTFPKHIATYRLLGKAHLEQQRISDATDVFQRVLTAVPDDFISNVGMSIIREDENNLDAAIWHMELAYEAQPSNLAIQDELRRLYGRRDGVQPPKVRLTRGALSRMYAKGSLYDQAIAELHAAIAEDPNRPDLQLLLAQVYFQTAQRVEAVETCVDILKKLPLCLEANRILAVSLPDTEGSDAVKNYRQIVISMDPYFAFAEPEAISSDQVPDNAINIERLEWKSGIQVGETPSEPSWATSLGVSIDQPDDENIPEWLKSAEASSTGNDEQAAGASPFIWDTQEVEKIITESSKPEGEIPDWMKDAGWQPTSGEVAQPTEEIKPVELNADAPINEDLEKADLPDWLKGIAPNGVVGDEMSEAPAEEELSNPWLEPRQPGPTDSIVNWLEEEKPVRGSTPPAESDEADQILDEEVPDWLKDLDVTQPAATSADEPAELSPIPASEAGALSGQPGTPEPEGSAEPATEPQAEQPESVIPLELTAAEEAPAEAVEEIPDWLREIAGELPTASAFITADQDASAETIPEEPISPPASSEELPSEEISPPVEEIPAAEEPEAVEASSEALAAPVAEEQPEVVETPVSEQPEIEQFPPAEELPVEEIPAVEELEAVEAPTEALAAPVAEEQPEVEETPLSELPESEQALPDEELPAEEIPQTPTEVPVTEEPEAVEAPIEAQTASVAEGQPEVEEIPVSEQPAGGQILPADELSFEEITPVEEEAPSTEQIQAIEAPSEEQVAPLEGELSESEAQPLAEELVSEQVSPAEELAVEEIFPEGQEIPAAEQEQAPEGPTEAQVGAISEELPEIEGEVVPGESVSEATLEVELPAVSEDLQPAEAGEVSAPTESLQAETPEQPQAAESIAVTEIPSEAEVPSEIAEAPLEETPPAAVEQLPSDEFPSVEEQPAVEQLPTAAEEPTAEALPVEGAEEFAWLEDLAAEQSSEQEELVAPPEEGEISPPEWVKLEEEPTTEEIPSSPPAEGVEAAPLPAEEIPDWIKGLGEEPEIEPASEAAQTPAPAEGEMAEAEELPAWLSEMEQAGSEQGAAVSPEEALAWESNELPDWLKELAESGELEATQEQAEAPSETQIPTAVVDTGVAPSEEIATPAEAAEAPEEVVLEAPPKPPEAEQPVEAEAALPVEELVEPAELAQEIPAQASEPTPSEPEPAELEPIEEEIKANEAILAEAREAVTNDQPSEAAQAYSSLIRQDFQLEEIIKDLNDAVYRFPVNVDMWVTLGDAHHRTNNLQEALDAYTKAEELVR